jgi:hypothetical protein
MMIHICLRLMDAFFMRVIVIGAVVVPSLDPDGCLPGLALIANLPAARLPV